MHLHQKDVTKLAADSLSAIHAKPLRYMVRWFLTCMPCMQEELLVNVKKQARPVGQLLFQVEERQQKMTFSMYPHQCIMHMHASQQESNTVSLY